MRETKSKGIADFWEGISVKVYLKNGHGYEGEILKNSNIFNDLNIAISREFFFMKDVNSDLVQIFVDEVSVIKSKGGSAE